MDPQTNGPQLLYGLRYFTHIVREQKPATFHEQDTVLRIAGNDQLFHHTDRNTLHKVGEPTPNWLMRSLGKA